jgi:hypothetical protein
LDIKAQIDLNIIIAGGSNTPLSAINISSKHKIRNENLELNDTVDQINLGKIYRISSQKTTQNMYSSH